MTRERGRAVIERFLDETGLERVEPASAVADRLLGEARAHLRLARLGIGGDEDDPSGSLQLAYDAARKACAALLATQGLRATTSGGHRAVIDSAGEQFGGSGGMAAFNRLDRLRRRRHASEYPDSTTPSVTAEDAERSIDLAREVVDAAEQLLASGRLDRFV